MKKILTSILTLLIWNSAFAEITLPALFTDNMVLQQNTSVSIWGKAAAGSKVTVVTSWNNARYQARSDAAGSWKLQVRTTKAGGPYDVRISDGKTITLKNILLGEVWLCSGQSNMEMPVRGFNNQPVWNSNDLLMEAANPEIRLFRVERQMSRKPLADVKSTPWEVANAKSVKEFSAVGYQFGKLLQARLKVPVGLIMTTWGGTMIEAWMNQPSLSIFPSVKIPAATDTLRMMKNDPTVLYNAMLHPLIGYGIKGAIWYQGEQNRSNPQIYDELMVSMVSEWRKLWGVGEFPFYFVQIAPYRYNDKLGPSSFLREAQLQAASKIPNSGMVVSTDAGEERSIHPGDKLTISKRLAWWALSKNYGFEGLACESPVLDSMTIKDSTAILTFKSAPNGLTAFGKPVTGFEIAGSDKVFHPASARITGKGLIIESDRVKDPVAVRYAFADWVQANLYNTEGLPATPFRTDNW